MDKQSLKQYRQLCQEIRELEEEKEALAAGNVPGSWPIGVGGHSRGRVKDCVGDTAARLWQLSQLLAQRLNQPEERRIMRFYYIEGLTWEQTAERLECSVRQVNRRQRQIMQQLFPPEKEKRAS